MRRLHRSLEIVGWDAAALADEVRDAIAAFTDRNAALMTPGDDWTIVAFVTPGDTADAAQPTVCVHGCPLPVRRLGAPIRNRRRSLHHRRPPSSRQLLARRAEVPQPHALLPRRPRSRPPLPRLAGLLLDQRGFIGEASTANVVCYLPDRGLVTPRLDGVLPGISQQFLFELADELGIPHSEADILPASSPPPTRCFLTSTSICIQPVVTAGRRSQSRAATPARSTANSSPPGANKSASTSPPKPSSSRIDSPAILTGRNQLRHGVLRG